MMGGGLIKIIGASNVVIFLMINLFFKVDNNRFYLKYIILTLPFLGVKFLPNLDGFTAISTIFFLFLYQKNDLNFFERQFYNVVVFCLFLSILIGFFVADIKPDLDTIFHFFKLIPAFLFSSLIIKEIAEDSLFFQEVISWFKYLLIFSFLFLLAQMIIGPQFSLSGSLRPNVFISNGIRYPSFLADPQHYSQFVSVLCFVCLIKHKDSKYDYKDLLLVLLSLIAIMSSGGRSGLMGFLLGMALIIIFSRGYYKFIFIFAGIGLYFLVMQFQDKFSIFKRGTDLDNAYAFRYSIWVEAFDIFKKNPFFGIGLDNYSKHIFLHNPNQFWMDNNELLPFDVPENGNLKLLTELGGIGFTLIYMLFLYPVISAIYYFFRNKDFNFLLFFCAMLSFLLSFNGTYTFGEQRVFILIIAIIACIIGYKHLSIYELQNENADQEE